MRRMATTLTIMSACMLAVPAAAQQAAPQSVEEMDTLNRTEAAQELPDVGDTEEQEAAGEGVAPEDLDLSPEAARAIEEALTSAGYDPGAADGEWTEESAQALTIFKQTEGIEGEGIDAETLQALGLEDRAEELGLADAATTPAGGQTTTEGTAAD